MGVSYEAPGHEGEPVATPSEPGLPCPDRSCLFLRLALAAFAAKIDENGPGLDAKMLSRSRRWSRTGRTLNSDEALKFRRGTGRRPVEGRKSFEEGLTSVDSKTVSSGSTPDRTRAVK